MAMDIVNKQATKMPKLLVAPIEKIDVPNHLLNTKIYAKLKHNELFEVTPVEVHFAGFELKPNGTNKKHQQKLRIINISDEVQRLTILPPQTKYFELLYVKPERLVPGFAVEVQITFKPDEYKYYNDSICIHSKSEQQLIVPIHAYPIMSSYSFPTEYKFPNVPIGKTLTRSFTLRSSAPIDFEYMIDILEKHPSFDVSPLEGIIPYNRDTTINITFTAKEFCTAIMVIQLVVSQFNAKPIICRFCASSKPGLDKEQVALKLEGLMIEREGADRKQANVVDPRMISPLHLSRINRKTDMNAKFKQDDTENDIEIDGFRIPKELNSVWAVSKVLNQTKGRVKLKELAKNSSVNQNLSVQHKEKIFLQKVLVLEDEERRNQLKWQVKLGENSIENQAKQEILLSRAQAEHRYKLSIGEPVLDEELNRKFNEYKSTRTTRFYNQVNHELLKSL